MGAGNSCAHDPQSARSPQIDTSLPYLHPQTALSDFRNFNLPSKIRNGMLLGRAHLALGQHALCVSALEAALQLTRVGECSYVLLEGLVVYERAAAGIEAGGAAPHWPKDTCQERLVEATGRFGLPEAA